MGESAPAIYCRYVWKLYFWKTCKNALPQQSLHSRFGQVNEQSIHVMNCKREILNDIHRNPKYSTKNNNTSCDWLETVLYIHCRDGITIQISDKSFQIHQDTNPGELFNLVMISPPVFILQYYGFTAQFQCNVIYITLHLR